MKYIIKDTQKNELRKDFTSNNKRELEEEFRHYWYEINYDDRIANTRYTYFYLTDELIDKIVFAESFNCSPEKYLKEQGFKVVCRE